MILLSILILLIAAAIIFHDTIKTFIHDDPLGCFESIKSFVNSFKKSTHTKSTKHTTETTKNSVTEKDLENNKFIEKIDKLYKELLAKQEALASSDSISMIDCKYNELYASFENLQKNFNKLQKSHNALMKVEHHNAEIINTLVSHYTTLMGKTYMLEQYIKMFESQMPEKYAEWVNKMNVSNALKATAVKNLQNINAAAATLQQTYNTAVTGTCDTSTQSFSGITF